MVSNMFKTRKKRLREECWNVNYSFILWLNEHLKIYKEDASRYVDLTHHKFTYKGKEYVQKEIIDKLIELTDNLIRDEHYFDLLKETDDMVDEMLDLFVLVFPALWW